MVRSRGRVRVQRWVSVLATVFNVAAGASQLFYIYDGPAVRDLTTGILSCFRKYYDDIPPWQDSYLLAELMTEIWMHRAMLEHPQRTTNPDEATYFYIPAYFELSFRTWVYCPKKAIRSAALVAELLQSPYFRRYGGSDHFMTCFSFFCKRQFSGSESDIVARVAIGNGEPGSSWWSTWGCFNKVIGLPYAARTDLTAEAAARPPSERPTTFFFRGSTRGRPERLNLAAAANVVANTDIGTPTDNQDEAVKLDDSYTTRIGQSRFCFAPRGDTPTSRRLFDAISAGCIPVLQEMLVVQNDLPFADFIPYDEIAVIAPDSDFETPEALENLASRIMALPPAQVEAMHAALLQWRPYVTVAAADASRAGSFTELQASPQLGDAFFQHAVRVMGGAPYACTLPPFNPLEDSILYKQEDWPYKAAAQQAAREQRLADTTFPRVGRRDEWLSGRAETKVDPSRRLLFCGVPGAGSEALEAALVQGGAVWQPLQTSDAQAMQAAYSAQWVQVTVVRDPVVRLLATYLQEELGEGNAGAFKDFVARLAQQESAGRMEFEGNFRPQSGFCGARYRLFAAELQAEHLERDAPALLRALGMDESAVVPVARADATFSFGDGMSAHGGTAAHATTVELFAGCGWTEYYDATTLNLAAAVYEEDYTRLPYYNLERWLEAFERCGRGRAGHARVRQ